MPASPYEQLEQEFRRLHAFRGALSLLRWDAAVMMPRGSADVRGEQLAALETEHHALLTTPKVARLLERAEAGSSQLEDWPLANLREMRRQRDHAIATPPSLIARLAKATARAEVFWVEARKANDFKIFAPHLEEVVHLVRDKAALLGQARGSSTLRCLGRRLHTRYIHGGHRYDFQGAVAQASGPHQSSHRRAGGSRALAVGRQIQCVASALAVGGCAQGLGLSLRAWASRRERASISPKACRATSG